jgi:hypothetical protein
VEVTGHHYQGGCLISWLTLPSGVSTAWTFQHGAPSTPAVTGALDALAAAVRDAAMLEMMGVVEGVKAPDTPGTMIAPCRICDRQTPTNTTDQRGMTFCADHAPKGTP